MNRTKQIAFYGIMLVMTLAVIEGMAQAAYYIAYGEFNGAGPSRRQPTDGIVAGAAEWRGRPDFRRINHPYYGYTRVEAAHEMNQVPPPRREDGIVLIGLVGGSVARYVTPDFQNALEVWFREQDIPLRPVVLELAYKAMKQPQQAMIITNTLSLGGEYDIIINLDGYNELIFPHENYFNHGVSPFYPFEWPEQQSGQLTDTQKLLLGRIYALRQRQQRLDNFAAAEPWRRLALYGIVNRYLQERSAAQILSLNHELTAPRAGEYTLQRNGPQLALSPPPDAYDLSRRALRVWYRGSVMLHELSQLAGAEYYHFLQPNQYVPDSKPFTDQELAVAYNPARLDVQAYRDAYPLWPRLGDELRQLGINYHDLTQIFADNRETLYIDDCCHLNARGNELLAASMVQRMAPTLRRWAALATAQVGGDGTAARGGALYPAAQEISPVHAVNKAYFDVALVDNGTLRYSKDGCRPGDTADPFWVQITPLDAADLQPGNAVAGYNSYDFSFDRDGKVMDASGRCTVEYELPEYGIANVMTGQYNPETGQLRWRARITLDFGFTVTRATDGALRYARAHCRPVHLATRFFLHITPADAADLAPGRAEHGYNNYDFRGFSPNDGSIDAAGRCVAERSLPEYAIAVIVTGQYLPDVGRLWETRIDFEPP